MFSRLFEFAKQSHKNKIQPVIGSAVDAVDFFGCHFFKIKFNCLRIYLQIKADFRRFLVQQ